MMQSAAMAYIDYILDCLPVSVSTEPVYGDDQFTNCCCWNPSVVGTTMANNNMLNLYDTAVEHRESTLLCYRHGLDVFFSRFRGHLSTPVTLECFSIRRGVLSNHRVIRVEI